MSLDIGKSHHMSMCFIFQKYLLSTPSYVPTVLGPRRVGVVVSKADQIPALMEWIFQ